MPPIPDKQLEERILTAARRLWRERGEKGLTLRDVARTAGTTTPTVYKRFRNKEAIQLALASRFRTELFADVFASSRVEEIYRRFLDYAKANPHEYELLRLSWPQLSAPGRPRPGHVWASAQLAARFGGQAEDYGQAVDAVFFLCHGASTLLAVEGEAATHDAIREACVQICDRLIENIEIFRPCD
ncbi:MAG: helix-turn-helix domain-containing protein [Terriglobales bacterium]|jgi:AcrR family transcriptional regulator